MGVVALSLQDLTGKIPGLLPPCRLENKGVTARTQCVHSPYTGTLRSEIGNRGRVNARPMDEKHDITRTLTPRERLHYRFFYDQMMQLEHDLRHAVFHQFVVPRDWNGILTHEPVKGTTRVTIRLDEDLVRFFRKLGPGWQKTLNTVVRAYVKGRMAGIVKDLEEAVDPPGNRPKLGDAEDMFEDILKGRSAGDR